MKPLFLTLYSLSQRACFGLRQTYLSNTVSAKFEKDRTGVFPVLLML